MKAILITLLLLIASCAGYSVRQEDVDAWKGVDSDELFTHPKFSTLPRTKQTLKLGVELYNFTNSIPQKNDIDCTRRLNAFGDQDIRCTGGEDYEITCNHQFFVKDGKVLRYRPIGSCRTTCSSRPSSKPCVK